MTGVRKSHRQPSEKFGLTPIRLGGWCDSARTAAVAVLDRKDEAMIRVTIELLPWGNEERKRTIGVVEIANDGTGDHETGNYNATLSKEPPIAKTRGVWKRGRVEGFPRLKYGPYDLLYRVLKVCVGKRNDS